MDIVASAVVHERRSSLTAWEVPMTGKVRPAREGLFALGILGVLFAGSTRDAAAQDATLTVQPRTAATATTSPQAGEYPLDSVSGATVVVPPQCAGAKRCPLLAQLPGGGQPAEVMTGWMGPVAKKYGFVLLAFSEGSYEAADVDAALKETLRRFAIDPEKIAIAGRCASGGAGMTYGIENLHVFNRIASVSGGVPTDGMDPKNTTAEFFLDRGIHEASGLFEAAQDLRQAGHPVTVAIAIRGHEHQGGDYDFVGHWLQQTWATASPAARPKPAVVADPLPELTPEAVKQLTAFWTSFGKEPDSIIHAGRRAVLHEVAVPVAKEQAVAWITDMSALAAKYPSVAADLKQAGLTGQQHDAYRVALLSAMVLQGAGDGAGAVDPNSTAAKNLAFLDAHQD
jgi:hypothetical protein